MYQRGQLTVYGAHGVCRVAGEEVRSVDHKQVVYLVLEPVGQEGASYLVPTHNAAAMGKLRPMLTREELEQLLQASSDGWIAEENIRKQAYRETMGSGNAQRLIELLRGAYRHRRLQHSTGKKVHLCDENFLRDAERLLSGELALVLELSQEEARAYLRKALLEEQNG